MKQLNITLGRSVKANSWAGLNGFCNELNYLRSAISVEVLDVAYDHHDA